MQKKIFKKSNKKICVLFFFVLMKKVKTYIFTSKDSNKILEMQSNQNNFVTLKIVVITYIYLQKRSDCLFC